MDKLVEGPLVSAPALEPVSRFRRVLSFLGFTKSYNFVLNVIFAGAMFGFSLSRLEDYNYDGIFAINITPGYMYYMHAGSYRIGMIMHLAGALPAGLLLVLQFVPSIRHNFLLFHRVNGYTIMLLLLIANAGACIVLRCIDHGSRFAAETAEATLVILTTFGMAAAYYNVKRLQIDQHRAWMIRTMFYFGVIITTRVFTSLSAVIVSRIGGFYNTRSCAEIEYTYREYGLGPTILTSRYPSCFLPNGTLDGSVIVAVEATYDKMKPEEFGVAGDMGFGSALWMAIVIHVIGVEMYLSLTPREKERLRQVSYEKQLHAGFKNPGSAGWTVNRWGDANEWGPKENA